VQWDEGATRLLCVSREHMEIASLQAGTAPKDPIVMKLDSATTAASMDSFNIVIGNQDGYLTLYHPATGFYSNPLHFIFLFFSFFFFFLNFNDSISNKPQE
jgi:hypothetical protein